MPIHSRQPQQVDDALGEELSLLLGLLGKRLSLLKDLVDKRLSLHPGE
jgi:hypothetical protein